MLSNAIQSKHFRVYSLAVMALSLALTFAITSTESTVIAGFAGLAAGWFGGRLWGTLVYGNTTEGGDTDA